MNHMGAILPDLQMGSLGGTLLWIAIGLTIIVAAFTTGTGPILVAGVTLLVLAGIVFFVLKRAYWRLSRGPRSR